MDFLPQPKIRDERLARGCRVFIYIYILIYLFIHTHALTFCYTYLYTQLHIICAVLYLGLHTTGKPVHMYIYIYARVYMCAHVHSYRTHVPAFGTHPKQRVKEYPSRVRPCGSDVSLLLRIGAYLKCLTIPSWRYMFGTLLRKQRDLLKMTHCQIRFMKSLDSHSWVLEPSPIISTSKYVEAAAALPYASRNRCPWILNLHQWIPDPSPGHHQCWLRASASCSWFHTELVGFRVERYRRLRCQIYIHRTRQEWQIFLCITGPMSGFLSLGALGSDLAPIWAVLWHPAASAAPPSPRSRTATTLYSRSVAPPTSLSPSPSACCRTRCQSRFWSSCLICTAIRGCLPKDLIVG